MSARRIATLLDQAQPLQADFRTLGSTGLRHVGGYVLENVITRLRGRYAAQVFREMGETEPAVAAPLFLIKNIARGAKKSVHRASDSFKDREAADFVESCLHDMELPFDLQVSEHLSMVQYGFSISEIVFKRRCGRAAEPWMRSRFNDGRIGLRGLPQRSQDSVQQWTFDDHGNLTGFIQQAPPNYQPVFIPVEKMALFRTSSFKNNPEGESALLRCFVPWEMKRRIQLQEAIGIERDLAGVPIARVDSAILSADASEDEMALCESIKNIVTRVNNNEQGGIVFPSQYDENGRQLYDFQLLTSGGSRQFDTSRVLDRYTVEILRTFFADFLALGSSGSGAGSFAMHSDKTQLFCSTIDTYYAQIAYVYNHVLVPKLMELNGFDVSEYPRLEFAPIEHTDASALAASLQQLCAAGLIVPDPETERWIKEKMGMPITLDADRQMAEEPTMPRASAAAAGEQVHEIPSEEAAAQGQTARTLAADGQAAGLQAVLDAKIRQTPPPAPQGR